MNFPFYIYNKLMLVYLTILQNYWNICTRLILFNYPHFPEKAKDHQKCGFNKSWTLNFSFLERVRICLYFLYKITSQDDSIPVNTVSTYFKGPLLRQSCRCSNGDGGGFGLSDEAARRVVGGCTGAYPLSSESIKQLTVLKKRNANIS